MDNAGCKHLCALIERPLNGTFSTHALRTLLNISKYPDDLSAIWTERFTETHSSPQSLIAAACQAPNEDDGHCADH